MFFFFLINTETLTLTHFFVQTTRLLSLQPEILPKIKQLLSNCPASDWSFSFQTADFLLNRVKINNKTKQLLINF